MISGTVVTTIVNWLRYDIDIGNRTIFIDIEKIDIDISILKKVLINKNIGLLKKVDIDIISILTKLISIYRYCKGTEKVDFDIRPTSTFKS